MSDNESRGRATKSSSSSKKSSSSSKKSGSRSGSKERSGKKSGSRSGSKERSGSRSRSGSRERAQKPKRRSSDKNLKDAGIDNLIRLASPKARISGEIFPIIRRAIQDLVKDLVQRSEIYKDHARRSRFMVDDLEAALESLDQKFYGAKDEKATFARASLANGLPEYRKLREGQRPRNLMPLFLSPTGFEREIREHITGDVQLSESFRGHLQSFIESKIIELIQSAEKLATVNKLKTLVPREVKLAVEMDCLVKRMRA